MKVKTTVQSNLGAEDGQGTDLNGVLKPGKNLRREFNRVERGISTRD